MVDVLAGSLMMAARQPTHSLTALQMASASLTVLLNLLCLAYSPTTMHSTARRRPRHPSSRTPASNEGGLLLAFDMLCQRRP